MKHLFLCVLLLLSSAPLSADNQKKIVAALDECKGNLSPEEQKFANQLTDSNNISMFCTQFTPEQRKQAMQLKGQQDEAGNILTADLAVQQVAGNTLPPSKRSRRSWGGCPVK
jgi:hypothetical protein